MSLTVGILVIVLGIILSLLGCRKQFSVEERLGYFLLMYLPGIFLIGDGVGLLAVAAYEANLVVLGVSLTVLGTIISTIPFLLLTGLNPFILLTGLKPSEGIWMFLVSALATGIVSGILVLLGLWSYGIVIAILIIWAILLCLPPLYLLFNN